jgi:alpha-L-rhamnosidase
VVEWLFTTVLGIEIGEPGFSKVVIKPQPGAPLTWARGHYDSIQGRIASDWKMEGNRLTLNVTIPPNTSAEVHVPAPAAAAITEGGRPVIETPGVKVLRTGDGVVVFEVGSGTYRFGSATR